MPSDRLPVVQTAGDLAVLDPDTGELLLIHESSDHALTNAAERIAEIDRALFTYKRALAAELRSRHGVGTVHAGGYGFKVAEPTNWPQGATQDALNTLVDRGHITPGERERCMPSKPKPDARQLKALAGRLATSNPEAAKVLADACTVSPPSIRDIQREAVDAKETVE